VRQPNLMDFDLKDGRLGTEFGRQVCCVESFRLIEMAAAAHGYWGDLKRSIIRPKSSREELETERPNSKERIEYPAFDWAPDPIVVVDASSRVLCLNRAAQAVFLYSPEELLGRPLGTLASLAADGLHAASLSRLIAAAQRSSDGTRGHFHGRRKDGTNLPLHAGITRIMDRPEPALMVSLAQTTDRARADDAQHQMAALVESVTRREELLFQLIRYPSQTSIPVSSFWISHQRTADSIVKPDRPWIEVEKAQYKYGTHRSRPSDGF